MADNSKVYAISDSCRAYNIDLSSHSSSNESTDFKNEKRLIWLMNYEKSDELADKSLLQQSVKTTDNFSFWNPK